MSTRKQMTPAERIVAAAEKSVTEARERRAALNHERRQLAAELAGANASLSRALRDAGRRGEPLDTSELRGLAGRLERELAELDERLVGAGEAITEAERGVDQARLEHVPALCDVLVERADELLDRRTKLQERHAQEAAQQRNLEQELLVAWEPITQLARTHGWSNVGSLHGRAGLVDPDTLRPALLPHDPDIGLASVGPSANWPGWLQQAHGTSVAMQQQHETNLAQRAATVGA